MSKNHEIRTALQSITKGGNKSIVFSAEVISVENKTCTVEYAGMEISGVKLSPVLDSSSTSIIIKPALKSYISIIDNSNGELRDLYAFKYSDIQEIMIDEGKNGGLININDLTQKLNTLVDSFNSFVAKYNVHTHNVTAVGAPSGLSLSPGSRAVMFNARDYENTKIKH